MVRVAAAPMVPAPTVASALWATAPRTGCSYRRRPHAGLALPGVGEPIPFEVNSVSRSKVPPPSRRERRANARLDRAERPPAGARLAPADGSARLAIADGPRLRARSRRGDRGHRVRDPAVRSDGRPARRPSDPVRGVPHGRHRRRVGDRARRDRALLGLPVPCLQGVRDRRSCTGCSRTTSCRAWPASRRRHRVPGRGTPDESLELAAGAACAAEQGRYWQYHDLVFWNQGRENAGDHDAAFIGRVATAAGARLSEVGRVLSPVPTSGRRSRTRRAPRSAPGSTRRRPSASTARRSSASRNTTSLPR